MQLKKFLIFYNNIKFFKKYFFNFLGPGIEGILKIGLELLLVKILPLSEYGKYSFFINIYNIISQHLARLGVPETLIKYVPIYRQNKNLYLDFLGNSFSLMNLSCFIGSVIMILFGVVYHNNKIGFCLGIMAVIYGWITFIAYLYRSNFNFTKYILIYLILYPCFNVLCVYIWIAMSQKRQSSSAIYGLLISSIIIFCICLLDILKIKIKKIFFLIKICFKKFFFLKFRYIFGEIGFFPLFIFFIGLTSFLKPRINFFLIEHYLSFKEVGIYSFVLKICSPIALISQAINIPLASKLSHAFMLGQKENIKIYYREYQVITLTVLPPVIFFVLLFSDFVFILLKKDFPVKLSEYILILLFMEKSFEIINGPSSLTLQMCGFVKFDLFINIVNLFLSTIFSFFLIKKFSLIGAAISVFSFGILTNFVKLYILNKNIGIDLTVSFVSFLFILFLTIIRLFLI